MPLASHEPIIRVFITLLLSILYLLHPLIDSTLSFFSFTLYHPTCSGKGRPGNSSHAYHIPKTPPLLPHHS